MEEIRIDCRKTTDKETMVLTQKISDLVFDFNNTRPTDPHSQELVKQIFEGKFGMNSRVMAPLMGVRFNNVTIGNNVIINQNCLMMAAGGITIDDDAMLAANCQLLSNNHDPYERMIITCKPIHICKGAWLGAGATVTAGVTIGKYAIIGASSVVTHDIPDYAVAVGSPAKIIKYLDKDKEQK